MLGNYKLTEPQYENKDWVLNCFTDRKITSKNWNIINVECTDKLKKSREIKIRCDQYIDFDICIYIDARFTIKCNLDKFVEKNLKNDFLLMKHHRRCCAYDEARRCILKKRDNKDIISKQTDKYLREGFPKNFGLYACGIMVRKNTTDIINFMKLWYDEVHDYSYRDQISFPYTLWKYPIKIDTLNFRSTCDLFT